MKRFKFKLARLERLRDVRRKQARTRLSAALARVQILVQERETRQRALDASLAIPLPDCGTLDTASLRTNAAWQADMRRAIERAAAQEQKAREAAQKVAAVHAVVAREHRVLERLRERRRERWQREVELEDRKFLDEIRPRNGRTVSGDDDA